MSQIKIRTVLYLSVFLLVSAPLLAALVLFSQILVKKFEADFENQMIAHSDMVGNAFSLLERLHQSRGESALQQLKLEPEIWDDRLALQKFRDRFKLTYTSVVSEEGRFLRDSGETEVPFNDKTLFDFCPDYRLLLQRPQRIESTPILLDHPNRQPFKFLMSASPDGRRILQVGIHLKELMTFLEGFLLKADGGTSLALQTPSGDLLAKAGPDSQKMISLRDGDFTGKTRLIRDKNTTTILNKIPSLISDCCECSLKNLNQIGSEKYFYVLNLTKSNSEIQNFEKRVLVLTGVLVALVFVMATLVAHLITKTLLAQLLSLKLSVSSSSLENLKGEDLKDGRIEEINELTRAFRGLFSKLQSQKEEILEARTHEAVARTTQLLAHDVRKPFSMFKMIIDSVESADSVDEAKELLEESLPEVKQALASVDGLIADVMQIGTTAPPLLESVDPLVLSTSAMEELFRVFPRAAVEIESKFFHQHKVLADTVRIGRVFANVLGNAIQALNQRGKIWIFTSEKASCVEFTLGNAGSYIPPESLERLFEAFFTSGKKGGTGLGLAIAQKIVTAHGGKIFCKSEKSPEHPAGKVEFVFTLPCAAEVVQLNEIRKLPTHSSEIQASFAKFTLAQLSKTNAEEVELELQILSALNGKRNEILLLDDERIYSSGLNAFLQQSKKLADLIALSSFDAPFQMTARAKEIRPMLIICDIDLGGSGVSGIEVISQLRAEGYKGQICVHSNRFLESDNRAAMEAGANHIIPKPMTRLHLLRLILATLRSSSLFPVDS